jgi:hypothetical protein
MCMHFSAVLHQTKKIALLVDSSTEAPMESEAIRDRLLQGGGEAISFDYVRQILRASVQP